MRTRTPRPVVECMGIGKEREVRARGETGRQVHQTRAQPPFSGWLGASPAAHHQHHRPARTVRREQRVGELVARYREDGDVEALARGAEPLQEAHEARLLVRIGAAAAPARLPVVAWPFLVGDRRRRDDNVGNDRMQRWFMRTIIWDSRTRLPRPCTLPRPPVTPPPNKAKRYLSLTSRGRGRRARRRRRWRRPPATPQGAPRARARAA